MTRTTFGYVRVSTKDQCEDRQLLALRAFPVPERHIFTDKLSGKDFDRPQYQALLQRLGLGDALVVQSIDRLGCNYDEILRQWRLITKEKRADIVVLDMPLLDTRQTGRDLTGTFVADLVLQILSYVAQTEREKIRQRQKEGIAAARLRGVRFGRPRKAVPPGFARVNAQWQSGQISSRQAAQALHIAQDTFLRWARETGLSAHKMRVFRAGFLHTKGCTPATLSCVFSRRNAAGCTCAYYTPSERKYLLFRARLLRRGAFPKREGGRRAAFRLRQKVRQQEEAMKHRFQKTAKRWLAMLLCVGMLCQPGLFSAFAQEGPASPAPSATPGEAPAAAPAAAAAPRAGTEHPLTDAAFSLTGTLTIDGETPDENTAIQDGTNFNIRLD